MMPFLFRFDITSYWLILTTSAGKIWAKHLEIFVVQIKFDLLIKELSKYLKLRYHNIGVQRIIWYKKTHVRNAVLTQNLAHAMNLVDQ